MEVPGKLPGDIWFIISQLCDTLKGWEFVRGTKYETNYIQRRLPSWEILTNSSQSYPIIWIKAAIKSKGPIDEFAIAWSVKNGHTDIVKILLEAKAPIDINAVYWAVEYCHADIVKVLLEAKAHIDERSIYWAAKRGHTKIVKMLLEENAPINKDAIGWAASNGHTEIMLTLLKAKAPGTNKDNR